MNREQEEKNVSKKRETATAEALTSGDPRTELNSSLSVWELASADLDKGIRPMTNLRHIPCNTP